MTGGPVRERIAAVFSGGKQGSGYLLSQRVVLTARHVIVDDEDIRVIVPGRASLTRCDIVGGWTSEDCDVALLIAYEDLTSESTTVPWGRTDSLAPVRGCQAIGFPHVQRDGAGMLDTEQLTGTFKPGTGLLSGRYVLDSDHTPPASRPDGGSPWAGMSGAAVFSGEVLMGVVASDPHGWRHGRVEVTAARTLLDNRRLMRILGERGIEVPVVTPAGLPLNPDTEFEARYTQHVAAKHGTLTIFGIDLSDRSRAAWPLDAAYLSLEAARHDQHGHSEGYRPGPGPSLPADQALAGHDRVLLRGVAGSGKTTLVQWLAVSAARQEFDDSMGHLADRIPFVLPLRTIIRQGDPPLPAGFLTAIRSPLAGAQPPGWVDRVLAEGRGLLLIDGIDEIDERERERVRHWLRDLLTAFPRNQLLVTSRPSAVADSWLAADGFTELTLSPMSRHDVASFVRRWHDAARATCDDAEDRDRLDYYQESLLAAVRTKPDLGRLATNPLMCGLICALHRDRRGYLPIGRKELYDAALSMLLVRRDRERDVEVQLTEEPQIQLLQKLAYWLIRNGQAEMDQADAIDLFDAALPAMPAVSAQGDAKRIFRHLLIRSGLLREPAEGAVDFVHRTFQDYLGAKAAVEERDFDLMVKNAHHDQWEDVIRMAVAHARPAERARLLGKLITRGDRVKSHRTRLHLLATACLEHATELDPAVRAEVEFRAGAHLPPRTYAEADALAEVGPVVLDLLPGPDGLLAEEISAVVQTAGRIGTDAAIPVLARFCEVPTAAYVLPRYWGRFDADAYFTDVIARLPADSCLFFASSPEELALLTRAKPTNRVRVEGHFTEAELSAALRDNQVTRLDIAYNNRIRDLSLLRRAFPGLVDLGLIECPRITDLTPLSGWPLQYLALIKLDGVSSLDALASLDSLTGLLLNMPSGPAAPTGIPASLPLDWLSLTGAPAGNGLEDITAWPSLRAVALSEGCPDREGWRRLAELPSLESLHLFTSSSLAALPEAGVRLTGARTLHIPAEDGMPLTTVAEAFPSLKELHITARDGTNPALDVAPLAALPHLTSLRVNDATVENAEHLSGTVELTLFPRPRPQR
jgi:hypothetical protein